MITTEDFCKALERIEQEDSRKPIIVYPSWLWPEFCRRQGISEHTDRYETSGIIYYKQEIYR